MQRQALVPTTRLCSRTPACVNRDTKAAHGSPPRLQQCGWALAASHPTQKHGQMPRPQSVASEGASDQMVPWLKNLRCWPSASGRPLSASSQAWGRWSWGATLSLAVHLAISATSGNCNWPVVRADWSSTSVSELALGYHFFPLGIGGDPSFLETVAIINLVLNGVHHLRNSNCRP